MTKGDCQAVCAVKTSPTGGLVYAIQIASAKCASLRLLDAVAVAAHNNAP
jgi:hypothetical protein